jgi:hypothetical protein
MAFNLSQIVNKFLSTRPHSTSADGWENPYGSSSGQLVTSEADSWQARKARMGATRASYVNAINMATVGTTGSVINIIPKKGNVAFVSHITVSADNGGLVYFGNTVGSDIFYGNRKMFSAGSFDIKLDGSFMIREEGFTIKFNPDIANTKVWASVIWMEVAE